MSQAEEMKEKRQQFLERVKACVRADERGG